jgi:hypothetical protein
MTTSASLTAPPQAVPWTPHPHDSRTAPRCSKRCHAFALAALACSGNHLAGAYDIEPSGPFVVRQTFGIGAAQDLVLALDNSECARSLEVGVSTYEGRGLIGHELLHVVQGGGALYTVPLPPAIEGLRAIGIELAVEAGPCAGTFLAGFSLLAGDGATAASGLIPNHTPEWSNPNASDPGRAPAGGGMNSHLHIPPTRIGPGENVVFSFWNTCARSGTYAMRIKNLQVRDFSDTIVELPAYGIKQVSLSVGHDEPAMLIRGFGTFTLPRNTAGMDSCPPGPGPINGFMTLENARGETAAASGLPTGKRQHKPVSVTVPSRDL